MCVCVCVYMCFYFISLLLLYFYCKQHLNQITQPKHIDWVYEGWWSARGHTKENLKGKKRKSILLSFLTLTDYGLGFRGRFYCNCLAQSVFSKIFYVISIYCPVFFTILGNLIAIQLFYCLTFFYCRKELVEYLAF